MPPGRRRRRRCSPPPRRRGRVKTSARADEPGRRPPSLAGEAAFEIADPPARAGSDIDRAEAGPAIAALTARRQQAAGHLRIGAALLPTAGRQGRSTAGIGIATIVLARVAGGGVAGRGIAAALGDGLADQPAIVVADRAALAGR